MKYTLHELLKKHDREIDAIVWCILNRKYHWEFESAGDKGPWVCFKKGMCQSIPKYSTHLSTHTGSLLQYLVNEKNCICFVSDKGVSLRCGDYEIEFRGNINYFLPHAICIMYILVMQPSWLR